MATSGAAPPPPVQSDSADDATPTPHESAPDLDACGVLTDSDVEPYLGLTEPALLTCAREASFALAILVLDRL